MSAHWASSIEIIANLGNIKTSRKTKMFVSAVVDDAVDYSCQLNVTIE